MERTAIPEGSGNPQNTCKKGAFNHQSASLQHFQTRCIASALS
jgi:hypothetical protein